MPHDVLTDASRSTERRELGAVLGADLRTAGTELVTFRLLVRGEPVPRSEVRAVLTETTLHRATALGLLNGFDVDDDSYLLATACVLPERLPNGELAWVACDLPWTGDRPDHVPGPGNASRTLMRALPGDPVAVAADLGTGCGVVALHLSTLADRVIATDVSPRALAYAELTAALNDREWDLRAGSFAEPLARTGADVVDLVAANPPFVIGNPDAPAVFRDGSVTLAADLTAQLAAALPPNGTAVFLGNWAYRDGEDAPTTPIAAAAAGLACEIEERAVVTPEQYAEVWVGEDEQRAARWAAHLRADGIRAIGTGVVTLHRPA